MMRDSFNQNIVSLRFAELVTNMKSNKVIKSYAELSEKINYRRQSLHDIIKGNRDIPLNILQAFINAYNVAPSYFFDTTKSKVPIVSADSKMKFLKRDSDDIVETFDTIDISSISKEASIGFQLNDYWFMCKQLPIVSNIDVNKMYVIASENDIIAIATTGIDRKEKTLFYNRPYKSRLCHETPLSSINECWEVILTMHNPKSTLQTP